MAKSWPDVWLALIAKLPLSKLTSYQLTNLLGELIAFYFVYAWFKDAGWHPVPQTIVVLAIFGQLHICLKWACHR
jgi:hypothetical protein